MRRTLARPALAVTGLLLSLVGGDGSARGDQAPDAARHDALSMRVAFLERLVTTPESVSKIEVNGDDEARALLGAARRSLDAATEALRAGDLDATEESVTAGIKAIGEASRRVVRQSKAIERQVARHDRLQERITSFREAFDRIVTEKQDADVRALLDEPKMQRLLAQAGQLHKAGDYAGANDKLTQVAGMLEHALVAARSEETLVHTLSFATPREEYAYEKQRNNSYRLLIDMLEQKQAISGSGLAYLREMLAKNEQVREQADALNSKGETETAIEILERSTESLARALRANGVGM